MSEALAPIVSEAVAVPVGLNGDVLGETDVEGEPMHTHWPKAKPTTPYCSHVST